MTVALNQQRDAGLDRVIDGDLGQGRLVENFGVHGFPLG